MTAEIFIDYATLNVQLNTILVDQMQGRSADHRFKVFHLLFTVFWVDLTNSYL